MPRVSRVELPAKGKRARWALAIALGVAGVCLLAYAFVQLVATHSGWQEINANATDGPNSAEEFVLLYDLGASGVSAGAENRAIAALYTKTVERAFQLFTADLAYAGVHNVRYLNEHPNEEVEVDAALYDAFALIERSGDRTLYLAPAWETYQCLFSSQDDAQAAAVDPCRDEALRGFYAEVAAYARDPNAVRVELLDGSRVRLAVSDAYLAFCEEEEIGRLIDFGPMTNAFVADILADTLAQAGYVRGTLSSYDGFLRPLGADVAVSCNVYARLDGAVYSAAALRGEGLRSICALRAYPMNSLDSRRFYAYADGEVRTALLDARDGLPRHAVDELTACSETLGCAQSLLALLPLYVADEWDERSLLPLAEDGLYAVYARGSELRASSSHLALDNLYDANGVRFTAALIDGAK